MPEIEYVNNIIRKYNIPITGVIHVGAHKFEELPCYNYANITNDKIIWIEANKKLIDNCTNKSIMVKNYCVSDKDNEEIEFNISNATGSSSILELELHKKHYPGIIFTDKVKMKTKTIKTIYKDEKIPNNFANFLHLDIQGVELKALKGCGDLLNVYDYINTEVNLLPMYKDCALLYEIDEYLLKYNFIRIETEFGPGPRKTIDAKWPGKRDYTIDAWGDALYIKKSKLTDKNIGERTQINK